MYYNSIHNIVHLANNKTQEVKCDVLVGNICTITYTLNITDI